MIDVRDSFFQSDPFEMIPLGTSAFFAFKGVELQIEQCGWNGPWVSDCFGMEVRPPPSLSLGIYSHLHSIHSRC
jgi:hypothetical protein